MDDTTVNKSRKITITIVVLVIAAVIAIAYFWYPTFSAPSGGALNITITDCSSISPQTAIAAVGQRIVFENSDKTAHSILIGGNSLSVPASGSAALSANLSYGTGTYGYACDGQLTPNKIIIESSSGASTSGAAQPGALVGFKSSYDTQQPSMQACLKSALGSEFDQAYNDPTYVPSAAAQNAVQACTSPGSTTSQGVTATSSIGFRFMYDNQPAPVQSCIKAVLGDQFDRAYAGLSYILPTADISKLNACFLSTQTP